ncbi:MAG: transglutaminase domain-containing protein, partial [Acidobacteria bacterium]|nr:transglutaminase domain-containing protein [Acidobacteriota bacterium]
MSRIFAFRAAWWAVNLSLAASLVCLAYAALREWSVRQYLHGFSDAVVSVSATPEQKIDAILEWMRAGPPRAEAARADDLSPRNPENTLNYRQLLVVCGSATNAFLNLSRSSGLQSRRLLLLTPDRKTKHVVAEVLVDGRWIVVDPSFRIVMRDGSGIALTRKELQNPLKFHEAVSGVPNYPADYGYDRYAHVRLARLPLDGFHLRKLLESVLPGWDEIFDWSLLLERESFFVLVMTT